MRENKQTAAYTVVQEENPTYRTGSTKPPKSYRGALAFLFSAVIFVCGICTILNLMQVNVLKALYRQPDTRQNQVSFCAPREQVTAQPGFDGQDLPQFWQDFRSLPEGIYITRANEGLGLLPGDILLSVNGKKVSTWDSLLELLSKYQPGDKVKIIVFRDGAEKKLNLTIPR